MPRTAKPQTQTENEAAFAKWIEPRITKIVALVSGLSACPVSGSKKQRDRVQSAISDAYISSMMFLEGKGKPFKL